MRLAALFLALCWVGCAHVVAADDQRLAVIVHPERIDALDLGALRTIYLRQRQFWRDGNPIVPLNQPAASAIREQFSRQVLGGGSEQLSDFWNRQYFQGVLPPATLSSDSAVRLYVAADRNAIGYIHEDAADATVRVVLRLEASTPIADVPH